MIKTKLYKYQQDNLKFHLARNKSADFSELGLGKSLISLSKIDILKQQQLIKRALIICPKSVVLVWEEEIKKHSTLSCITLTGSLKDKIKLLAINSDIYILSYDSVPGRKRTVGILFHFLLGRYFGMVILDEVTHVKNFGAIRTKAITALCDTIKYSIVLSGTPITNSPASIITIYRIMDGGQTFGRNFFATRNMFFENRGWSFPDWQIREDKKHELQKRLYLNAIRLRKEDCIELPPKIYLKRYTELTGINREIYRTIASELLKILQFPTGQVNIKNGLVKLAKLSQLTSGFLYTDNNVQLFPTNPKLELLQEVMEEIPQNYKIIIYAKWRQDIENITQLLNKLHIEYAVLSGSTRNRQIPIQQFMSGNARILVSQITAGAYGLTLTVAHTIIYFSLGFSVIEFLQSQDRIHRIGQTKSCIYISLLCEKTVDEYMYRTLQEKVNIAKSLLDFKLIERLKEQLCL